MNLQNHIMFQIRLSSVFFCFAQDHQPKAGDIFFKFKKISFIIIVSFFVLSPFGYTYASGGGQYDLELNVARTNSIYSQSLNSGIDSSGAFTKVIPLELPASRADLLPNLELSYNSNDRANNSIFGKGWSLSIPKIERVNKLGSEQIFYRNDFQSSLDGELVEDSGISFLPKVEHGDFRDYEFVNNKWVVADKGGTEWKFGEASNSRQTNSASSSQTTTWFIEEIRDTNDNFTSFKYFKDNNQLYIDTISYNGHGSATGTVEIIFNRELRTDIATSSEVGFPVNTRYRISDIGVYFDGVLIKKYDLNYIIGDNGYASLLESVDVSTDFASGTTTLQLYDFEYGTSNEGWAHNTSWDIPVTFGDGVRMGDVNGDGLIDILYTDAGGSRQVYLNEDNVWVLNASWTIPVSLAASEKTDLADVNGDGRIDIIQSKSSVGGPIKQVFVNNGSGWVLNASWTIPVFFGNETQLADVNGDGLSDIIYTTSGGVRQVYINSGSGWVLSSNFVPPEGIGTSNNIRLGDVNGDGLIDFLQSKSSVAGPIKQVFVNNGSSWVYDSTWDNIPEYFSDKTALIDINMDGLVDILHTENSSAKSVYINNGSGWTYDSAWVIPDVIAYSERTVFADVNGDGHMDFVKSKNTGVPIKIVWEHDGGMSDYLVKITENKGGSEVVEYKPSTSYRSSSDELLNPDLPFVIQTVGNTTKDNEFNSVVKETFTYENGQFYFDAADTEDRQLAGFGKITKVSDLNKEISYFHQGDSVASTSEENIDSADLIGTNYRTEIRDLSNDLYQINRYNYSTSSLNGGSTFISLSSEVQLDYDGDSDVRAIANSYTYNGINGSLLTHTEWGEVDADTDGTFIDSGSDNRKTIYEYATGGNIVIPSKVTLEDGTATKVSESRYYYDNQSLGSVTVGNLTKKEDWIDSTNYVDTEWTYDIYGNKLTVTDPRNKTTSYEYDLFNTFVASTTNAVGHNAQYDYDYRSNQVSTTTDSNGNIFTIHFDGFGRPISETIPDPQNGSHVLKTSWVYTDTPGSASVRQQTYLNGSTTQNTYSYLDGFGRIIQKRIEAEDSNKYIVLDYRYGNNNLLEKKSLPYFKNGSARTNIVTDPDLLTLYSYDPLSRITEVETTIGTTYNNYDQWTETSTDTKNNSKDYLYDAYKRLVGVVEYLGTGSYETTYEWNENNNLTEITDADGNVRNITYDGLSRRIVLEDLHDPLDGTFGSWVFAYDPAGNITSTFDPKSQTVQYTYDSINRILTEDYTGAVGAEVTYSYDSCIEGVGYLCQVSTGLVTTTNTYTHNGLIESEVKNLGGNTYTTEYDYDRQGNKTLVTYPDNSEVRYTYNKGGQAEVVEQRENGGTFYNIIEDFDYGPHGNIVYQKHGNGAETTKSYNENAQYRLTSIVTNASTTMGMGGPGPEFANLEAKFSELNAMSIESLSVTPQVKTDTIMNEESDGVYVVDETLSSASSTDADLTSDSLGTNFRPNIKEIEIGAVETKVVNLTSSDDLEFASSTSKLLVTQKVLKNPKIEARALFVSSKKADRKNFVENGNEYELILGRDNEVDEKVTFSAKKLKPEFSIKKWDNAVDVSVSYSGLEVIGEAKNHDNLLRWQNESDSKEVHAYPLRESEELPGGGFELEVVLSEKPDSNRFDFDIDGYENLDFIYQPELSEEEKEDGAIRPENVVGSYAVYHKELYGHMLGGANYSTGKVFHIYRPKISDADGNEVWGELNYEDGKLTVVAPHEFLDNAEYPIVVDPTFGFTSTGNSSRAIYPNNIHAIAATAPHDGEIISLHVYAQLNNYNWKGIVANEANKQILTNGVSPVQTSSSYSHVWHSINYVNKPNITQGTSYLLGYVHNGNNSKDPIYIKYDNGGTGYYDSSNSYTSPQNLTGETPRNYYRSAMYVTYATIQAPIAPFNLRTNGQVNPVDLASSSPSFTAIFSDPDSGSTGQKYRIQVDDNSDFNSVYWDSGQTIMATTTNGSSGQAIAYTGSQLASTTPYYWRIKFWDQGNLESPWSTSTASFSLVAEPSGSSTPPAILSGGINYVYDSVGNIIQIINTTTLTSAATTSFTYDDLYRLTSASTTNATTTPYSRTYTYSSIGNILSKSDQGSYTYAETGYANPHAATLVGGVYNSYDNNGNIISTSEGDNFEWNYRNELVASYGNATITYGYDHNGDRVFKTTFEGTTYYPFSTYEITNTGTTTKHIYMGDVLIATIEGSGAGAQTYHNHLDHLGSTSVVTDGIGALQSVIDYYPFGDIRIDEQYGDFSHNRKYLGETRDDETDLSYLNARYYDGARGQFISQDPVFWTIGSNSEIREKFGVDMMTLLSDPQQLNSYSYARNNPIVNKDPTGNLTWNAIWNDPVGSLRNAAGWGAVSLGGNVMNKPFASALLRHSASLEPDDVTIDSGNQKQYGNPIDQVMGTSEYKNYLEKTIQKAETGEMTNSGHFEFGNKSDLYYSLHGANIESQVSQENGEWVVNSTVSDKYDFNPTNPQTYKGTLTRIPATQAYNDQQRGVLSNYNVTIKINDRIKK